jgi:hypothetical protein
MQPQEVFRSFLTMVAQTVGRVLSVGLLADGTTHRILGAFRAACAISPQSAQRFHTQSAYEGHVFTQLVELGIIQESAPGRYFLDERVLASFRTRGQFE